MRAGEAVPRTGEDLELRSWYARVHVFHDREGHERALVGRQEQRGSADGAEVGREIGADEEIGQVEEKERAIAAARR